MCSAVMPIWGCSPWLRCRRRDQRAFVGRIGPRMRSSTRPRPRNGVADLLPRGCAAPRGTRSSAHAVLRWRCGQRCGAAVPGLLIATRPRWSRAWNTANGVTSCPRSARSPAATTASTPAPSRPSRSTPRRASSPAIPPPPATRRPTSGCVVSGVEIGAAWRRDLEGGPHLPLGQARRSQLHRSHLRQPLRGRERRTCADLVALIGARGAPPHDGASRTSPRYYAERYRRQSPGKPPLTAQDSA